MSPKILPPWKEFLEELDSQLGGPLELHCIGGFAVVAAYSLPRSTNDLDYFSLEPSNCAAYLEKVAGQGSGLARKHKIYVQRAAVASLPECYDERLSELFAGHFKNLRLWILDPYDLVLSKLSRNADRDREDVKHIVQLCSLETRVLRYRYTSELRPILIGDVRQHDQTLEFWIEAYFQSAS